MESSTPVHYAPDGATPLCGEESPDVAVDVLPEMVKHCDDCLELVAEDLADNNEYRGHCLHCRQEIRAQGGVEWRRAVRRPCPHCGRAGW